jgi:hypothetical protein
MRHNKKFVVALTVGLSACTPFVLAPGAAEVRVTSAAGDVVSCAPVGNLQAPKDSSGAIDVLHVLGQFRNQTVGLGGNVAFVTEGSLSFPKAGVAYRCPPQSGAGA